MKLMNPPQNTSTFGGAYQIHPNLRVFSSNPEYIDLQNLSTHNLLTKIGIISDTHGYLDEEVFRYFKSCDEIWHAGDFGDVSIAEKLSHFKPLRGVYGNIDGNTISNIYPEQIVFSCEDVKVLIRHIGGYPPKYNKQTKIELLKHQPQLMVTGHSHIVKIMYDKVLECLHINPGAAGKQGWHKEKTVVTLVIDGKEMKDCKLIKL